MPKSLHSGIKRVSVPKPHWPPFHCKPETTIKKIFYLLLSFVSEQTNNGVYG